MDIELTTGEVSQMLADSEGKIAIRLPAMSGNDVGIDRITGLLSQLEAEMQIDIVIYSSNALVHTRITKKTGADSLATICQKFLYGMHLDYLPYTEVLVFMPENEENLGMLRKICARYGILDIGKITARAL